MTTWQMATDETWSADVDETMTKLVRASEEYAAGVVTSVGRRADGTPTFITSVCHQPRDPNHEEDGFDYVGIWIDLSDPETISAVWGRLPMEDLV